MKKVLLLFILLILADGKLVTAVVIWIIRVTLDPMEPHLVFIQQIEQMPPEFRIFAGFLSLLTQPRARQPLAQPLVMPSTTYLLSEYRSTEHGSLRVSRAVITPSSSMRLFVVDGSGAGKLLFRLAVLQDRTPAAGSRIARACTICVNGYSFHWFSPEYRFFSRVSAHEIGLQSNP